LHLLEFYIYNDFSATAFYFNMKKEKDKNQGKLFVVATPIGNLDDLSPRALNVLAKVDFIACEDTRVTKKIMFAFGLNKELVSFHQHSQLQKIDQITNRLKAGQKAALLTDAGTPAISDPGSQLIKELLKENIEIMPIPGPSALTTLWSVAGIDGHYFLFLGFPPHKKGREKFFQEVLASKYPVIIYESPHRIFKALESLSDRELVVGRELTKLHETIYRGSGREIKEILESDRNNQKGEFTILVKI